jgi:hypothetical protein
MKKVFLILSIVALASCGGSSSTETVVDSTKVDSVVVMDTVPVVDSAVVTEPVVGGPLQDGSEIK